jgi:hypothetical protein
MDCEVKPGFAVMIRLALLSFLVATVAAKHRPTPAGMWPEECVHRIPSGTHIEKKSSGVDYTFPNGTKSHREACKSAPVRPDLPKHNTSYQDLGRKLQASQHAYPVTFFANINGDLDTFSANYNVPQPPTTDAGQVIYWWLGVQNQEPSSDVLQPVLGWESGQWTYASWNCCPAGHQHESEPLDVSPGDVLYGSVDNTVGNGYKVVSKVGGRQTDLSADDHDPQVLPLLAMETYGVGTSSCDLLPSSPMSMTNVAVSPSAAFESDDASGFNLKQCGWSVQFNGQTLEVTPPTKTNNTIVV